MANFVQALRNARKKTKDKVDTTARGKEIIAILKKYDYPSLAFSTTTL